jgi:diguanylate cyclase (GGDEF)-like protein/PAS domain S-box-containing protein
MDPIQQQSALARISTLEAELQQLQQLQQLQAIAQQQLRQYRQDREKLQADLAAATAESQASFDLATVGIAHITLDRRWRRVNPFFCKMLGYAKAELENKKCEDFTYPDDLEQERHGFDEVLSGRRATYAWEQRYRCKSGKVIWGHQGLSLVRDGQGRPCYFISVVENIDARICATQELERSRARLKAVLESLSESVMVFNQAGDLLEVNAAAMRLFEYARETDVTGRPETLDKTFEAHTLEGVPVPVSEWPVSSLFRGQPVSNVEFVVRRRNSGKVWIGSFSGSVIWDPARAEPLAVLTVRDISKQKQAEIALRVSEARLRLAFDNIPDALAIYDTDLRIQAVNAALLKQVDVGLEELVGRSEQAVAAHSYLALWRSLLHAALETGIVQREDMTYPSAAGFRNVAVTCVPLLDSAGKVHEVMVICHDYTERQRAEEKARHAALHDPLTNLPNRALLFEYVRHVFAAAQRAGSQVAVAFIDLDRFKPINDLHGHDVGDAVLRQVAARLQENLRDLDLVFRLGGDEFLALLPGIAGDAVSTALAGHLLNVIAAPYRVGSLELSLSMSVGISLYPEHASDIDTLMSQADAAMYAAKQAGCNNVQLYTSTMAERVYSRRRIEHRIKEALSQDEFCLHYQPLISLQTQEVVGVEALLRLRGDTLTPDCFIPVAESTGLIWQLGEWALVQACHQHVAWRQAGLPAIPIAVNVSALQFRRSDFAEAFHAILDGQCADAAAIQVELTETAVMEDVDHAIAVLQQMRSKGVKVSLDDFGTGYSSLNYLSRLPLDKIKVDKSFVHRLHSDNGSRAITESIIALGRTLNLEIVAEGIESAQEMEYLRRHGCNLVQGYYLCKPLAGEAFATWYQLRH